MIWVMILNDIPETNDMHDVMMNDMSKANNMPEWYPWDMIPIANDIYDVMMLNDIPTLMIWCNDIEWYHWD
jgi:hypothetical protein